MLCLQNGSAVLHRAAANGYLDMCQWLLSVGAYANTTDKVSPLCAVPSPLTSHSDLMSLRMCLCACVCQFGRTAVSQALSQEHISVAKAIRSFATCASAVAIMLSYECKREESVQQWLQCSEEEMWATAALI